jgi:hypothetical protein
VVSGNAGEDSAPTFGEGGWTGGVAEVRVTGSETFTISGTLLPYSNTSGGSTGLAYGGGEDGHDAILVEISTEGPPAFEVSASRGIRGIRTIYGEPPCEVAYQEASDTRIEGSFRCEYVEIDGGDGPVMLEGSFTATR